MREEPGSVQEADLSWENTVSWEVSRTNEIPHCMVQ